MRGRSGRPKPFPLGAPLPSFIHDPAQDQGARRLRQNQTSAEALLWRALRGRDFEDMKFRRQAPLGPYVVDFLCLEHRLVLELDGGIHDAPFYDVERQHAREAWLQAQNFTVLRFPTSEVEHRINDVLSRIRDALTQS